MKFVSILSICICCVLSTVNLNGQDVQIITELSRDTVRVGDQFVLKYKVSGGQIVDVKTSDLEDFNILAGPNVSTSMSILNGVMNQESSYSFVLQAREQGDFTISPAVLILKEGEYKSDTVQIHIFDNPNGKVIEDLNSKDSSKKKSKKKRKTYKI